MTLEHDPVSPGVARDVTAQGEEAEALRRERDLLSAVVDMADRVNRTGGMKGETRGIVKCQR